MIYIVFAISVVLSLIAEKRNKIVYLLAAATVLSLFIGLRSKEIGIDTEMYYSILTNLKRGVWSPNVEYGFLLVTWIIMQVFNGALWAPFLVFAFVTNFLILIRFWQLRDRYKLTYMVLLYLILFYPQSCNIMRQYISVAIVFFATGFLEKDQKVLFGVALLCATAIHTSALITAVYIPLYLIFYDGKTQKKYIFLLLLMAVAPVLALKGFSRIASYYAKYFVSRNIRIGFMNLARLGMLGFSLWLSRDLFLKYQPDADQGCENSPMNIIALCSSAIAILLYCSGYYLPTFTRLGYYFGLFELPFISLVSKEGRGWQVLRCGYILVLGYYIYVNAMGGWSGLLAYSSWLM